MKYQVVYSVGTRSEKITEIIEQSLPNKNNSNYFNIVNRIKAEIFKDIVSDMYGIFMKSNV